MRHLLEAQTRVGDRDYAGALMQLERLARDLDVELPSLKLPQRANLIGLQSAYFLGDCALAESCAGVVVRQLNDKAHRKKGAQLAYAADYMFRFLEHCGGRFIDREDVFLGLAAKIEASGRIYDLSKIPQHLRHEMPLETLSN
ncbi:hypothetical protein [Brevundimonas sp.]|uniref:hypothetical protein n=1 Tax=Brevundimonas sp. TaxID=1871086 RepID=UPI003A90B130